MRFTCTVKDAECGLYYITCLGDSGAWYKHLFETIHNCDYDVDIEPGDVIDDCTVIDINEKIMTAISNNNGSIMRRRSSLAASEKVHKLLLQKLHEQLQLIRKDGTT